MKFVVIALLIGVLTGCVMERVPAVDERGREWLIECNESNVSSDGVVIVGAKCTALCISPSGAAHPLGDK